MLDDNSGIQVQQSSAVPLGMGLSSRYRRFRGSSIARAALFVLLPFLATVTPRSALATVHSKSKTDGAFSDDPAQRGGASNVGDLRSSNQAVDRRPDTPSSDITGPLGPFHVGPMVGLLSLPRPVNAELLIKYDDVVSLGFQYSALPKIQVGDLSMAISEVGVGTRWFPFRGSFFLGASFAHQTLTFAMPDSSSDKMSGVQIGRLVATPQVGWLWRWESGIALEFAVGAEFAFAASSQFTGDPSSGTQDLVHVLETAPLPNLNLLRVGFLL